MRRQFTVNDGLLFKKVVIEVGGIVVGVKVFICGIPFSKGVK